MKILSSLREAVSKRLSGPKSTPRFVRFAERYAERIRRWPKAPAPAAGAARAGILVTPWFQSAVPYYNLEYALALAARGLRVTLLWDPRSVFFNVARQAEIDQIAGVLAQVRDRFEIVDLSELPSCDEAPPPYFNELLNENAVRATLGESRNEQLLADSPEERARFVAHFSKIRHYLATEKFAWLMIPGGIWVTSGILSTVAAEFGISYSTYDCGAGVLWWCHNSIAAHADEMAIALKEAWERRHENPDGVQHMLRLADARLDQRMKGRDELALQPRVAGNSSEGADLLVPLNLRWDAAALLRCDLYPSVREWLRSILEWLEKNPKVTVAIRQHPGERLEGFASSENWPALIAEYPSLASQVRFVAAADDVNSYDLIQNAKVVLPFTSRIGVEAAMLGKPVVLASKCYYRNNGFTWSAKTREEYFTLIEDVLSGKIATTEETRLRARLGYSIVENCVEAQTNFTPAPEDFDLWIDVAPEELWGRPQNIEILDALISRESLPLLRYRRRLGLTSKS